MLRKKSLHNSKKLIPLLIILFTFLLSISSSSNIVATSDELYVAGIPDEYPLEYYDKKSNSYKGVLTDLLQTAAKNANLSIKYVSNSTKDNRLSLAKNLQTDIICTLNITDKELEDAGLIRGSEILAYQKNNKKISISFAYTKSIAPESKNLLEQELQKIDKNKLFELISETTALDYEENSAFLVFHRIIPILLFVVVIALFIMPFLLNKRKKQIESITFTDDGTGYYNYAMWKLKYQKHVKHENYQHYAVLYLYTGLENISHVYGYREVADAIHLIGDVCMKQINEEYEGVARFNELYYVFFVRFSSDEKLKERILNIHEAIQTEFQQRKKRYFLELHTGVYKLTQSTTDLNMIMQYSKVALEYAKAHYLSSAVYNEAVERETLSGYIMEHEAIHGLMHQEFIMYLQPIHDTNSGNICGAEALVRWQNPIRGLLKPGDFLDIMRRKNLIGKMNMEIYRQGCHLLKTEKDKGNYPILLFNFSAENFEDERFAADLLAITQQYNADPKQLIIQLQQIADNKTSTIFIENIKKLREYQFEVCLSGLELDKTFFEYLKYDVNYIKIRRELLLNATSQKGRKVLDSVVNLCHDLKLNIICVGVEKEEQAKILQELNCELATGFYYHYPVSQEIFSDLLESKQM